jgi:predicted transcriptional regulator
MDTSKHQQRKVTIQLPQALIDAMKAQAMAHRRSFTGEIVWALQEYVIRQQPKQQTEREGQ